MSDTDPRADRTAPRNDADGGAAAGEPSRPDPLSLVRAQGRPALPRRFYREAGLAAQDGGFRLTLDGRGARTPAGAPLVLPTRALGERIVAEWAAVAEVVDPARMPATRLANSAIDGVAGRSAAVAEDLAAYAGTDLVAYRAGDPPRLVAAQSAAWDPLVAWAREALGASLVLGEGVMHVKQSAGTLTALRAAIDRVESPFALAGLHAMTTLTGSLLLALAVLHGRLDPEAAWAAAHVDETYQAGVWGLDAEAAERLASRRAEFTAAAETARLA